MNLTIKRISDAETLPLRHKVLWPNHPIEQSKVEGDETASHFGGFLDGGLVCVASLFEDDGIRLRKFATDPDYQGQGFGSEMLAYLLERAKETDATFFWFDARESALPFYERNGFKPEGPRFFKNAVPYRRVRRSLAD
ncbi:GNAT family N-acetyltransferase [Cognatishimia activa]|uniref:Ribosomal-protein-alanine acetyltransferase n=1 Tax=Cognatishimia activa TaxID=1715691 RepID=A0A0P1ISL1_9RHOB|nr:GNAT family N-acetyltransferase [Cognatishimia activa]CUI71000.1 ribosomal-protein-alanine acetyltransferase [Cognatishimia activa]CUK26585.1 ribosomal-protein-alanine acetyltransferase [Cognatishimia activa]